MRERPILFSAPMVRALLAGTKTQTRRIAKPRRRPSLFEVEEDGSPMWTDGYILDPGNAGWRMADNPYGVPGDVLWVKETYRLEQGAGKPAQSEGYLVHYEADGAANPEHEWGAMARPSIHMPRWASRLSLRITDVRVERLNDISEADAIAEGIDRVENNFGNGPAYCDYALGDIADNAEWYRDPRRSYRSLWDHINGPGAWDANPWVWVVSFERA